jgi:hypothetical protein
MFKKGLYNGVPNVNETLFETPCITSGSQIES